MRIFVATLGILLSGVAFAGQMTPMAENIVNEDEPYTTIAEFDVRMAMGANVFEFNYEEPVEASQLSFWYEQSLRCQGVGVSKVNFCTGTDDAECTSSDANPCDGIRFAWKLLPFNP